MDYTSTYEEKVSELNQLNKKAQNNQERLTKNRERALNCVVLAAACWGVDAVAGTVLPRILNVLVDMPATIVFTCSVYAGAGFGIATAVRLGVKQFLQSKITSKEKELAQFKQHTYNQHRDVAVRSRQIVKVHETGQEKSIHKPICRHMQQRKIEWSRARSE